MVKKIIFTREQAPDSAWLEKIRQAGFGSADAEDFAAPEQLVQSQSG